ncbi:MAG: type II toxin-antitoxin system HipA family toxin [Nannocystis sp.]|nr:type II toxin-antitoxin system HipA family toxin [Nannocystis sp.]MBA3549276.1 type II toxin-antitoxin system HipA family toxin [Nannocystis sp.]
MTVELEVFLNETPVARLVRDDDGRVRLRFLNSYVRMRRRPMLGLYYLGKLNSPLDPELRVPPFFTNLLPDPDGALRALIVAAAGARDDQEMRLLALLGEDLPGAVRIRTAAEMAEEAPYPLPPRSLHLDGSRLRFSLAGLQLKFSMVRDGKGLTLPANGRGGDWIVKLPDVQFAGVPEAEYMVMQWARASGIEVPEVDVVTHAQLSGIPDTRGATAEAALCLAVRRFDRPTGGPRVHIEDFAQVFGRAAFQKYNENLPPGTRPLGFEALARAVRLYAPDDRREFVRRLVFMILSGNADAHLKNWSFIYRDGRTPRLSPAYDLVPTVVYPGTSDQLALPLFGEQAFSSVTLDTFRRLASALQETPEVLVQWASEDVERIMDAWSQVGGIEYEVRFALERHHAALRSAGLLHP